MFIYFLKGQLPWQGFKIDMKEEKFEKVLEKKKNTALEVLCESFFIELGCPLEFYDYTPHPRSNFKSIVPLKGQILRQRTLTYFTRGSITVWLTSCSTGLYSAALLILNQQQIYLFGEIQIGQRGGQMYSDTSPYEVSDCFSS